MQLEAEAEAALHAAARRLISAKQEQLSTAARLAAQVLGYSATG